MRVVQKPIEVGDNVRMPGAVASPWGVVDLLDDRFARVRYMGGRRTAWFTIVDIQKLRDEWMERQRQRRQRNRKAAKAREAVRRRAS